MTPLRYSSKEYGGFSLVIGCVYSGGQEAEEEDDGKTHVKCFVLRIGGLEGIVSGPGFEFLSRGKSCSGDRSCVVFP